MDYFKIPFNHIKLKKIYFVVIKEFQIKDDMTIKQNLAYIRIGQANLVYEDHKGRRIC